MSVLVGDSLRESSRRRIPGHLDGPPGLLDNPSEPVAVQGLKQVVKGMGRILQGRSLAPNHLDDDVRSPIEQQEYELVGRPNLDSMVTQHVGWEVLDVLGDDPPSAGPNGRRQDMAIIGIWQAEVVDQVEIPLDKRIGQCFAHQLPRPAEPAQVKVGPLRSKGLERLVEDLLGPPGLEETLRG